MTLAERSRNDVKDKGEKKNKRKWNKWNKNKVLISSTWKCHNPLSSQQSAVNDLKEKSETIKEDEMTYKKEEWERKQKEDRMT